MPNLHGVEPQNESLQVEDINRFDHFESMSLVELTRNSFQGGISAQKWLELCKLLISKNTIPERDVASHLSNSILVLFRSYPGDPTLQAYLRKALLNDPSAIENTDPLIPLPTFVSTFLQAARSSELHNSLSLTVLLQTVLEAHYASSSNLNKSSNSLVLLTDTPSTVMRAVQDAVALLRTIVTISSPSSTNVNPNQPHLPNLSSSLLLILLSSLHIPTDLHRVPLQQALSLYAELSETISVLRMRFGGTSEADMEVVSVLETFLVSLSLVVGDEGRGMGGMGIPGMGIHGMGMGVGLDLGIQGFAGSAAGFGFGRGVSTSDGHTLGQGKTDDVEEGGMITLGLLLNYMVTYASPTWGAGDTSHALTLLLAIYRSSSFSSRTLSVFLCQVMQVSLSCLAAQRPGVSRSGGGGKVWLWRAFVLGRLPTLLVSFAEVLVALGSDSNPNVNVTLAITSSSASTQKIDMRKALQEATFSLLRRQDLFVQVDQTITASRAREREREVASSENAAGAEEEGNNNPQTRPFVRDLLQQFVTQSLVTAEIAVQVDPLFSSGSTEGGSNNQKWYAEAVGPDSSVDLAAFIETKIFHGQDPKEVKGFVRNAWNDPGCHAVFAGVVNKRFTSSVSAMDVDSLGHTCKILHTYDQALEVVSLHVRVYDLIFYSLLFLEEYDCETVGDPQTALSHLGDVVLFVQYALVKFKFETYEFTKNNRTVSSAPFTDVELYMRAHGRGPEDLITYQTWQKALFDSGSEGIEDNILRATKPKILLRIAIPLVSQAITASTSMHKFDKEVLMNGIAYFTGPLLNWVLVGVVKYLIREMQRGFVTPAHYEILQILILSPSCPRSVLVLCSQQIALLASDSMKKRQMSVGGRTSAFNVEMVGKAVVEALGSSGEDLFASSTSPNTTSDGTQIQSQGQNSGLVWYQSVQHAIRHAFAMVRQRRSSQHSTSGTKSAWSSPLPPLPPPPSLDLQHCLNMVRPIKFLQILWAEVQAAANLGDLEACRRIVTFTLTMPLVEETTSLNGGAHQRQFPLLPLFLHVVLPGIVAQADELQPKEEQTVIVDLLVNVISSVLNAALHLEWAMRSVSEQQLQKQTSQQHRQQQQQQTPAAPSQDQLAIPVLGQTSSGMARRLAVDLRRNRTSDVSKMILQRLATTHPFVANFPVFKSELGT